MVFQQHKGDGFVRGPVLQQVRENSLKIIRRWCPLTGGWSPLFKIIVNSADGQIGTYMSRDGAECTTWYVV